MRNNNKKKKSSNPTNKGGINATVIDTKKKIRTEKDLDKKIKHSDLADVGKIVNNGNYYWYYKVPFWYKILWLIDAFITGLIYLVTAIVLSWSVDEYLVKSLDRNDSKFFVFIQACGEVMYLILVFYFIIWFYGNYLPDLCYKPPKEHIYLKNYSTGFFVLFGIFVAEPKLVKKFQFVFNTADDQKSEKLDNFLTCWDDRNILTIGACIPRP